MRDKSLERSSSGPKRPYTLVNSKLSSIFNISFTNSDIYNVITLSENTIIVKYVVHLQQQQQQ